MTNPWKHLPKLGALIRGHFLAGLFVLLPIAVAVWMLVWALGMLWRLRELMPEALRPDNSFVEIGVVVGVSLLLALGVSVLGWVSTQLLGKKILEFIGEVIQRIPVVRSIYGALDQLLKTMAMNGGAQQFNRVVYLEYPRKGI